MNNTPDSPTRSTPAPSNESASNDKNFKVTFTYTVREFRVFGAESSAQASELALFIPSVELERAHPGLEGFQVESIEPVTVSAEEKATLDGYQFNYSQEAAKVGIPSQVSIAGAVCGKYLNDKYRAENLAELLKSLWRELRWNPAFWFWRIRPDGREQPLAVRLRISGNDRAQLVLLAFRFLMTNDGDSLLPQVAVALPEQA